MPILVRPVREQLEHDRIIRLLQAKYKRKHEVAINVGTEQTAPVESGTAQVFPDLVLYGTERSRKLQGTVEVETGESVNSLEALAQWAPFSRLRAPFYLYIPPSSFDTVRRLCADHHIPVAEIWTYHVVADQVRFTMVHRSQEAIDAAAKAAAEKPEKPAAPAKPATPAVKASAKPAAEPAKAKTVEKSAKAEKAPAKAARPVAKAAAKTVKNGKASAAKAVAKKPAAKPAARVKAKPAARKR